MSNATIDRPIITREIRRCSVLKLDLKGRFVYIDDQAEQMLLCSRENLFGRSIAGFLDEESYSSILAIFHSGPHFETFFKAVELTIIDSGGNMHPLEAIISLNFIGGNPANYQLILIPSKSNLRNAAGNFDFNSISQKLIDIIAEFDGDRDWRHITDYLLNLPNVIRAGIYEYRSNSLLLLAASPEIADDDSANFAAINDNHLGVVLYRQTYMNKELSWPGNQPNNIAEIAFPLVWNSDCFGIIRLLYSGNLGDIDTRCENFFHFMSVVLSGYLKIQ
jgi:hypothetical protein